MGEPKLSFMERDGFLPARPLNRLEAPLPADLFAVLIAEAVGEVRLTRRGSGPFLDRDWSKIGNCVPGFPQVAHCGRLLHLILALWWPGAGHTLEIATRRG